MQIHGYDMYIENLCKRIRLCTFNSFQKENNDLKTLSYSSNVVQKLTKWANLKKKLEEKYVHKKINIFYVKLYNKVLI